MGATLFRKGKTHVVKGIECELKVFPVSSFKQRLESDEGWVSDVEDLLESTENSTEETTDDTKQNATGTDVVPGQPEPNDETDETENEQVPEDAQPEAQPNVEPAEVEKSGGPQEPEAGLTPAGVEADTNGTGLLSNAEIRAAAEKAGIANYATARIKNLRAELGL